MFTYRCVYICVCMWIHSACSVLVLVKEKPEDVCLQTAYAQSVSVTL